MSATVLSVDDLAVEYGRTLVFHGVSFRLGEGQSLGVIGANGAGKTTLLRTLAGCVTPRQGEIRIDNEDRRQALAKGSVCYFAGDATLPGSARAASWSSLGNGEAVTADWRPMRALSRGTRQLLGLRTALARNHSRLIVLDEPWEGLDPDASRWLSATVQAKRDRGAAVVLSSHRLHDLAGLCDAYLFLVSRHASLLQAHDIAQVGPVTAALLLEEFDRLRGGTPPLRASG